MRMISMAVAATLLSTAAMAQSIPAPTAGGAPLAMGQIHGGVTPPAPVSSVPTPTGGPRTLGTPVAYGSFGGGAMGGVPMGVPSLSVSPGGGGGGGLPSAKDVGGPVFGAIKK